MPNPLIVREVTIARAALLMKSYIKKRRPVMLWGAPGIGKSDVTFQVADDLFAEKSATIRQAAGLARIPVIDFRLNIREPVDLRGIPVTDPVTKTTLWYTPNELPRVERDGEFGILFLDEINTGSPQMMAVAMQLVLDRKVGDYVLPDGWIVVAAGNRVADRASAQRMPTALKNRFAHIHVVADVGAWVKWAVANDVAPEMIAFVRFRPALLHKMPAGDETSFPTPRSLTAAADFVDEPEDIRRDLIAGFVGDDVASEIDGFIRLYKSIGTLDGIIDNPTTAPIPTEGSLRYATFTGLARMATRANFAKIAVYAERLDSEGQTLLMHDAVLRDAKLKETSAYSTWAVNNAHVTIQ